MYERLLDRSLKPTVEDLAAYCGQNRAGFERLNAALTARYHTVTEIRFPYGKSYGWCVTHRLNKKLVCDLFAESNAFTVMLRLSDRQYAAVYDSVSAYAKQYIDGRYPCGDGGWIHYRVSTEEQLGDIETLLNEKCRRSGGTDV